jgi:formylglycine-generating enzyme required for sulfatase activity
MSPEQIAGEDADPRSDVWALGAVLYEMLTGQVPFNGESHWVVMNAVATREPAGPRTIRSELPKELEAAVMGALEKDPSKRTGSTDELRQQLEACRVGQAGAGPAAAAPSPWQAIRRPVVAIPTVAIILLLALWSISSASQGAEERRAREETLPQVLALLDRDETAEALALVQRLEDIIPNDPVLAEATAAASVTGSIVTEPPGANIYVMAYGDPDAEWELLGQSPLESIRLPRVSGIRFRAELAGFGTRDVATGVPGFYFGRLNSQPITLLEEGMVPPEMVYVPGGPGWLRITGADIVDRRELAPYFIDRYEVTNAEYSEFVQAGAYEQPEFWEGLTKVTARHCPGQKPWPFSSTSPAVPDRRRGSWANIPRAGRSTPYRA